MTAARTRLADVWADWNIWLEELSNWRFVAVTASVNVLVYVIVALVLGLTANFNLATFITSGVVETIVITTLFAWKRWR